MQELERHSRAPLLAHLIAAARNTGTIYYSQLADVLSHNVVPGHVADQQIGPLAGGLMDYIWTAFPNAPPINMLVVSKAKGIASKGANDYLRKYFHLKRLPSSDSRKLELVMQAVSDAQNYEQWDEVYRRLFGVEPPAVAPPGATHFDEDGQGDNPRYKGGPESPEHKRLKRYVCDHPGEFGLRGVLEATEEKRLLSGDELDVFVVTKRARVGIEVKSCRSGDADLVRGIYQCVKYQAVLQAQFGHLPDAPDVETLLVTEAVLPPDIAKIAKRLAVRTVVKRVNPS